MIGIEYVFVSVAIFLVLLILSREAYVTLKQRLMVRVQCWFCHKKTRVHHVDSNSWFCAECDQYNGFLKDGDYNRTIPSQYEEKYNECITLIGRSKHVWKQGTTLCDTCNYKQELKIKQLASFVPMDDKCYDLEIEHFRNQLEESYRLCPQCEIVLMNVLNSQQDLGQRKLLKKVIKKIQEQSQPMLYLTLLFSLLLFFSSLAKCYNFEETEAASEIKNWLQESFVSEKIPHNYSYFLCDGPGNCEYNVSLENSSFLLLFVGVVIQTLSYIKHKSLWCFLNWVSWILVILISYIQNDPKLPLHYLEVVISLVSFISTSWILFKSNTSLVMENKNTYKKRPLDKTGHSKIHLGGKVFEPHLGASQVDCSPGVLKPEKRRPIRSFVQPARWDIPSNWTAKDPMEDLGIGQLSLGSRSPSSFNQIFNRSPSSKTQQSSFLVSPKLNLDPGLSPRSSSNSSSGYGSYMGWERTSNSPSVIDEVYDPSFEPYMTSLHPCYQPPCLIRHQTPHTSQFPSPTPITCYHIATRYQRMYLPPEKNVVPELAPNKSEGLSLWNFLYILPMLFLVCSNLFLIWTIYYNKELSMKGV